MKIVFGIIIGAILGTGFSAWALSSSEADRLDREKVNALSKIADRVARISDAIRDGNGKLDGIKSAVSDAARNCK